MAKRITRNVKDVKDVTTFGINHTTQNDLINDDKNVFVHQKGKFEKITHQIDTLSSDGSVTIGEKDDKDNVSLSVYTGYVDKITSIDKSLIVGKKTNGTVNVEVDYAPINEKIQVANSQLEEQVMEVIDNLSTKTFLYKIEGYTVDTESNFIIYIELPTIYNSTPSFENFMTYLSENNITGKLCDGVSINGYRFSFININEDGELKLNLIDHDNDSDEVHYYVYDVFSIDNITLI